MVTQVLTRVLLKMTENYMKVKVNAWSTEGLEFRRSGHLAVKIDSVFSSANIPKELFLFFHLVRIYIENTVIHDCHPTTFMISFYER